MARSLLDENRQLTRAIELIKLGARLQVLEAETELPYERLLRLYKEVAGRSPSKGQLPFSTDWFTTWQPNIHGSLFLNLHRWVGKAAALEDIDAIIHAYRLYLAEVRSAGVDPLLSITRAWRLVRFVDSGMLCLMTCRGCGGHFVSHTYELADRFTCRLCEPPARAGRARRTGAIH